MEKLLNIINTTIENESHSEKRTRDLELLLKAEAINIIKPHAEAGVGFAFEAISRIASSGYSRNSELKESIGELTRIISMYLEKNDTKNE